MITGVHGVMFSRDAEALRGKGVELAGPVSDEGFGLMTAIRVPGGGELGLYAPRHPTPSPG